MSSVPGRGNGLTAASYVALADLAPPVADALLETLRREAIAAYAAPAADRPVVAPATRALRPLDRVYVDRAASARARVVLTAELPRLIAAARQGRAETDEPDVPTVDDEVWAQIVAAYEASDVATEPQRRWPASEDVDPPAASTPASPAPLLSAPADDARTQPARESDEGEHYVPPPPPPLPRLDPLGKAAWSAVLGAPALLLVALLLGLPLDGWLGAGLVALFAGGFITLVARMKDRDDGWDDGAVV